MGLVTPSSPAEHGHQGVSGALDRALKYVSPQLPPMQTLGLTALAIARPTSSLRVPPPCPSSPLRLPPLPSCGGGRPAPLHACGKDRGPLTRLVHLAGGADLVVASTAACVTPCARVEARTASAVAAGHPVVFALYLAELQPVPTAPMRGGTRGLPCYAFRADVHVAIRARAEEAHLPSGQRPPGPHGPSHHTAPTAASNAASCRTCPRPHLWPSRVRSWASASVEASSHCVEASSHCVEASSLCASRSRVELERPGLKTRL